MSDLMRPDLWSAQDIAMATRGQVIGEFSVQGLSIDTRTLQRGDLFIAIKDVRDGHDFIDSALSAGAGGVLMAKPVTPDSNHAALAIVVADTQQALRDLAVAGRDRSQALRIGVTGSAGKTSVKEALYTVLSEFGPAHKSQKSFNNHLGVPISLAAMPELSQYGIFEMGMNHAGELTQLSEMVRPDIAIITNVEIAHLANFKDVTDIAKAKAEIINGIVSGGTLILNGDNPHTPMIEDLAQAKQIKVIKFGRSDDNDIAIISTNSHAQGGNMRLRIEGQQVDVTLMVPGAHWFENAAVVMAAAYVAGLNLRKAAMALRKIRAATGRGQIFTAAIAGKTLTIIDESYNANPASMRAAFAAAALKTGRKIAILGDMGELGSDELSLHADLAQPLIEAGFSRIICLGESMRALRGALPQPMRAAVLDNAKAAFQALKDEAMDGDIVLIKGSNSAGLGALVQILHNEKE